VLYVPGDLFRDFARNRYPLTRALVGGLLRTLAGRLAVSVAAPVCVDVVLRRKKSKTIIHLVNRASGIPNQPNNGAIDEIPPVGPVTIRMRVPGKPPRVRLAFERGTLTTRYKPGKPLGPLTLSVSRVAIHAAVVVG
jgi:hypothetical protein